MEQKDLGQLFFTGISGLTLTEEEEQFIRDENIGGVILFKENYSDPAQLAELINSIQVLRDEYPLWIAVDQEGGRVKRFRTHFTQFPSMLEVASLDSPKITFEVHKVIGEELKAAGVNLNLSPVCDVFTNPKNTVIGDRSFGRTPDIVEKHVSAAIRGLHTGGVIGCAKHFPGHGDTSKDSHYELPYVNKSQKDLEECELIPFIKASKSRVEFVMMAHLVVDAIDPTLPCTLSAKAYDYLRTHLKYNRLIISDDMNMKAITDKFSTKEAAVMALDAGVDILEYRNMASAREALEGVKEAFKNRVLKKNKVEDSINRIYECKKRHLAEYQPIYIPSLEKLINSGKHKALLDKLNPSSKILTPILEE